MFPAVEAGEFIELKEREVCEIEVMIAEESGMCGYALFTEYVEAAGAGESPGTSCSEPVLSYRRQMARYHFMKILMSGWAWRMNEG